MQLRLENTHVQLQELMTQRDALIEEIKCECACAAPSFATATRSRRCVVTLCLAATIYERPLNLETVHPCTPFALPSCTCTCNCVCVCVRHVPALVTCSSSSHTFGRHAAGLKERHARDVTTLRGEHNAALQSQEDRLNKQHQLDTDRGTDRDTGRGTDRGTD